jgi:hypothetical protein
LDLLPSLLELNYAMLSSAGTWVLAPLTQTPALTLSVLLRTDNSLDSLLVDNLTTEASTTTAALSPQLNFLSASTTDSESLTEELMARTDSPPQLLNPLYFLLDLLLLLSLLDSPTTAALSTLTGRELVPTSLYFTGILVEETLSTLVTRLLTTSTEALLTLLSSLLATADFTDSTSREHPLVDLPSLRSSKSDSLPFLRLLV